MDPLEILEGCKNAGKYFEFVHDPKPFVQGKSKIHYSGPVFMELVWIAVVVLNGLL